MTVLFSSHCVMPHAPVLMAVMNQMYHVVNSRISPKVAEEPMTDKV